MRIRHGTLAPGLVGQWQPDKRLLTLDCAKIRQAAPQAFWRYYLLVLVHELSHVFDTLVLRRKIMTRDEMLRAELKAYRVENFVSNFLGLSLDYSAEFMAGKSVETVFAHARQQAQVGAE